MEIKTFAVNALEVNCYILSDETREAAIIDCGAQYDSEYNQIEDYISQQGLIPVVALQTHTHFDHIFGLDFLREKYGLLARCHTADVETYANNARLLAALIRARITLPDAPLGEPFNDGYTIRFGNTALQVIHTPGHTPGGVCFYCSKDDILLSGDTLFCGSVGRTDFPGGSHPQLVEAITSRLLTLPAHTTVLPGHGPSTTIEAELHNPYLI